MTETVKPIRVLALAAEAYGGLGGIAQSTRDFLQALAAMPQIAEIKILPRHALEGDFIVPKGVTQLPPFPRKIAYTKKAISLALSQKPDIIYCGHAFMAPLAFLAARLTGAKLISHVHGLEIWKPLSYGARRALAASDAIFCVSQHTAQKAVETLGADPDRCAVIFNTVHERFNPGDCVAARAQFGIPERALVLSTVSRLDSGQQHKGHDRVIPLLMDLSKDIADLVYLIAGTGEDRARLAALAEQTGASHLVRFLGYVPDEDLPNLYRATNLYVMPSHGEGFGIAFVEAMSCGTPALGLDEGGAGDALRDGELGTAVTEAEFPLALAKAISTLPPNPAFLATQTRAIFGRPHFESRVVAAMAPLLADSTFAEKALSS